jgi:CHAT domain-containing protein
VVSSYTPTLSALISAQEQLGDAESENSTVLLVSLPEASGLSPLPNALVEADCVRRLVPHAQLNILSGDRASVSNVLGSLSDAVVLHLACHGHQSQDDPLTSGFTLHDGRLMLEKVMHLHLSKARLAYLSACETASTDEWQPDEAINLAATMLFVGFRSVIATMWCVSVLDQ